MRIPVAFCLLGLIAACAGTAQAGVPDVKRRPPDYPNISRDGDVRIQMPDGVRLNADVYHPARADGNRAPGRFPAILVQTQYVKTAADFAGSFEGLAGLGGLDLEIVKRGYVLVVVDVRGTGTSEGSWTAWGPEEQADSGRLGRWIREQPWSNGKFGTYGASYLGANQFFTAAQYPKGLKAIFPLIAPHDIYRDLAWRGGEVASGFLPWWLALTTTVGLFPSRDVATNPDDYVRVLADRISGGAEFPRETSLAALTGGDLAFDGPFYRLRSPESVLKRIEVPTFLLGGWWDVFQRGTPRNYQQVDGAPGAKQLVMGPWYHLTTGDGLGQRGAPSKLAALANAWFDRWLKGIRNGIDDAGPISSYELGSGRWRTYRSWPPPPVRYERRYLSGRRSGSARSLNDGSLATGRPGAGAASGAIRPASALCTRGVTQWSAGAVPPGLPCEEDNRLSEQTAFTFTTPPLSRDLHLAGPIALHLRGATNTSDATWLAMLTDVHPNGESVSLTAGWLLQSRRALDPKRSRRSRNGALSVPFHPFTRESLAPVVRNQPTGLDVEIFGTDARIRKGHRLRLVIGAGEIPLSLMPGPGAVTTAVSVNSVHFGGTDPSYLNLPVMQDRLAPMRVLRIAHRVRGRSLRVRVRCPDTERSCSLKLRLTVVSGRKRVRVLAGTRRFKVGPGKQRSVRVTLTRRARRVLRRRPAGLRVRALALQRDEAGIAARHSLTRRVRPSP